MSKVDDDDSQAEKGYEPQTVIDTLAWLSNVVFPAVFALMYTLFMFGVMGEDSSKVTCNVEHLSSSTKAQSKLKYEPLLSSSKRAKITYVNMTETFSKLFVIGLVINVFFGLFGIWDIGKIKVDIEIKKRKAQNEKEKEAREK